MSSTHQPNPRQPGPDRDAVTVLFARALDDDPAARTELRRRWLHDGCEHAGDAFWTLAVADAERAERDGTLPPMPVAHRDQLEAAIHEAAVAHLAAQQHG